MAIPAVVLGATGYVGGELLRLLHAHPQFDLFAAVSGSRHGDSIARVFPHLAGAYGKRKFVAPDAWGSHIEPGSALALFSTARHGVSAALVAGALATAESLNLDVHAVDSSADFRFSDADAYQAVYGTAHGAPDLLPQFRCAVPEHAANVTSKHVGHPGCFATAMLLASVPLVRAGVTDTPLYLSGVTGSTGSGRSPQAGTHHPERHSNFYAYKPLVHRHVPEVEALIGAACGQTAQVHFVPHSGPFARGIHVTLQAGLKTSIAEEEVRQILESFYRDSEFVHIVDGTPRLKDVIAGNYCHMGITTHRDTVVVTCVIDNLVKGAAGGAMQWMNRLWSLPDGSGLTQAAPAWT